MAVWWAWIDTAWVTNWLDPQKWPVRVMLLVLMFAGLILSTSIPEAFGERGLSFALAYAVIQVGRASFTLWALHGHSPVNFRNFQRITIWFSIFSALWIAGGLAEGELRLGLSRSRTADWNVEGGHMAERCGLFIIIALGESILVTGGTFAALTWTETGMAAFAIAFLGSVAMWWIYFDTGQERGLTRIAHSDEPGRLARLAYTYLHLPIVAGIILAAVGDEFLLAHPEGHTDWTTIAAVAGGPALYLLGVTLFKRSVTGRWPWTNLAGVAALVLMSHGAEGMTPLAFATRVAIVLVAAGALETAILRVFRRQVLP
jgi:low temperature requirement protein LtrA